MLNLFYKKAQATVTGSRDYRNLKGTVTFVQKKDGVHITADIYGLPESECGSGFFGFHIHEGRTCTGNTTDPFFDAGMHYNPGDLPHPCHAGDLPPLLASSGGRAYVSFVTDRFSLSEIIGRAVIIHSAPDDFTSQPSGNSGKKIACGIILAIKNSISI